MARTFHPLRVTDIRRETDDTVSVALEVPDELAGSFRFAPGQFLTFRVPGPEARSVTRSYSICSGLDDGELRVVVKRLHGGVFGVYAHSTLQIGDTLDTLAPLGRFTVPLDPAHEKAYLAIAAGSGIAPVMSLLRTILAREPGSRFTLLYGNRGTSSVIFADELADLKDTNLARLEVIHLFSREQQAAPLLNGRITAGKLDELGEHLLDLTAYDEAFVCGPEPMTLDIREALVSRGFPTEHVHLELYGSHGTPAPHPTHIADDSGRVQLDVTLAGMQTTVGAHPDDTVLDAAAAAGLDVPFSCTGGVCGTCRARVTDGAVQMTVNYALAQWELDAGFVLTCQSHPTTPKVAIDYDAM